MLNFTTTPCGVEIMDTDENVIPIDKREAPYCEYQPCELAPMDLFICIDENDHFTVRGYVCPD